MKKSELIFSAILVPVDYLMIVLAAVVAYGVRFTDIIEDIRPVVFTLPFSGYLFLSLLIAIGWLAIFAISKLYAITGQRRLIDEIARIFLACSTSIAAVIIFIFFRRELFSSRFIVIAVWVFSFLFVSIGRIIVRKIQRYFYKKNYGTHKVVIIGADKNSKLIYKEISKDKRLGYEVVRCVDCFNGGVRRIFDELYKNNCLDEIINADVNLSKEESKALVAYCRENHICFKYAVDVFRAQSANIEMGMIASIPVVEVKETRLDGWGRIWKRIFDIIISFILIIILSPLLLIVAMVIKIESKGPIFFSYKRVGEHGRPFKYFKFRSMKENSHELRYDKEFQKKYGNLREGTPMIKLKDDPRITKVGKFIRKYSIDELPELFNVFIGKMSLVGPRPHEIQEVAMYEKHHKKVLAIKPGMTGFAQISGRSDLNFEEEVSLDTFYVDNWSTRLDLWILLKTPLVLLSKRSAL